MFKNFFIGLKVYSGVFFLIGKLGFWKFFFVFIIISVLMVIFIGFLVWGFLDNIGVFILRIWVWEWGVEIFRIISDIIVGIIIIVLGLILYKYIIMVLSVLFMGIVLEKIEEYFMGNKIM